MKTYSSRELTIYISVILTVIAALFMILVAYFSPNLIFIAGFSIICLILNGAKKVYAIEKGENQLDLKLKNGQKIS